MNILVIDVGTSSIRGVLYDAKGQELFVHQIGYQVRFFDEIYAEQSASDWANTIVEISRETVRFCQEKGLTVDGLSLTSQRSSIIPVDAEGNALRPAIMWQDKRNGGIVAEMQDKVELVHSLTGARINTVFSGTKMTWFRRNQPELYAKTYKICTIADFIVHEITGQYRTDHTYGARSLLMNIRTRQWDDRLLELFEVEREKLCELVEPGSVIGHVTPEFGEKTGLTVGIPLVSGGGDQQCGALGQGVLASGKVELTTGTGAFMLGCCDRVPENLHSNVICGAHSVPGKYVLESSMLACAAMYNWAKRELFVDSDPQKPFERINAAVESSPAGANGCIALPYFQGRGTPDWNSNARGAFVNLSLGTTRQDLVRAVLEAIALEAKNNMDVLEGYAGSFDEIYIGGGLTHFDTFNQIQADVYQKTLLKETASAEQTAYGAWLGAAVALGWLPDYESAFAARQRAYLRYTPRAENREIYRLRQRQMNDAYAGLFAK